MGKFSDWEEWVGQQHPPIQKYAVREYLDNPENWGPPIPKYKAMMQRLSWEELLKVYLQVDEGSVSGVSWRRKLAGTSGPASKISEGSPALSGITSNSPKYESAKYTYFSGSFGGKHAAAHRVVNYLVTGEWAEVVDHIDHNPLNNSPSNLRSSTLVKNQQNRKRGKSLGFYWNKLAKKYYVRVASVLVSSEDNLLDARASYIRAYVHKYKHLPEPA